MDELIDRLIELKRIRDEAQQAMEEILGNAQSPAKKQRASQKCGTCGSEGHTSRTCTQKQTTLPTLSVVE